jgi:hypothetical protein
MSAEKDVLDVNKGNMKSIMTISNQLIKEITNFIELSGEPLIMNIESNYVNFIGIDTSRIFAYEITLPQSFFTDYQVTPSIVSFDTSILSKIIKTFNNEEQAIIEITPDITSINFLSPKYSRNYKLRNIVVDTEKVNSLNNLMKNMKSVNYDNNLRLDMKKFKSLIKSIEGLTEYVMITDNSIISKNEVSDKIYEFQYTLFDTSIYNAKSHPFRLDTIANLLEFSNANEVILYFVDSNKTKPKPLKTSIIYESNIDVNVYIAPIQ